MYGVVLVMSCVFWDLNLSEGAQGQTTDFWVGVVSSVLQWIFWETRTRLWNTCTFVLVCWETSLWRFCLVKSLQCIRVMWQVGLEKQRWVSDKSHVRCGRDMVVWGEWMEIGIWCRAWIIACCLDSPGPNHGSWISASVLIEQCSEPRIQVGPA